MLPVVAGKERTIQNIAGYSVVLVALTLLFGFTTAVGFVYVGVAAGLGVFLLFLALQLHRDQTSRRARHLYLYSLLYLALLFVGMMADSVIGV